MLLNAKTILKNPNNNVKLKKFNTAHKFIQTKTHAHAQLSKFVYIFSHLQ